MPKYGDRGGAVVKVIYNPSDRTMASDRNEYQEHFLGVKAAGA